MIARSRAPLVALMLGIAFAATSKATAAEDAGHALAQRFADGTAKDQARQKEKEDTARRAAEEAEMLARARAEAEQRKAAADKARAEAEAREAQRIAEEARAKKQRLAEEQREAREKFIADQIRAEEERQRAEVARAEDEKRRRAEEQRIADEKRITEQKRAQEDRERAEQERLAEERRLADEKRAADEERMAELRRQELAAEHKAAHERRAERMRELERERATRERTATATATATTRDTEPPAATTPTVAPPPMGLGAVPATQTATETAPERVTILLAMQPGKTGIRRFGKKTADPVLCAGPTCWIASGTDRAARKVTRGLALGPANTMGKRAAACNRHLTCVFRDVDLDAPSASIQPIDLRILRHDRREPMRLEADRTCRLAGKTLLCDKLFVSRSWRAWVIDEDLARKAGADALEAALSNGLSQSQSAALRATQ